MSTNFGQQVYSQGSGTASTTLLDAVRLPRNPTSGDNTYPLGKFWVNTSTNAVWYLATYSATPFGNGANWANLSAGSIAVGIDTINTILPDGFGNFTIESTNGSLNITPVTNGINLSVASSPITFQGNSGGPVTPDPMTQLLTVTGNTTTGITVIGNSPLHSLTVTGIQSTTTQQGVVTLATNAQTITGTDANNAVTSAGLAAKLGTQTAHSLAVFEGSSSALTALGAATNGQLPIGSTGADPVLATLTAGTGISITNGAGSITIGVTGSAVLETLTGNTGGAISPTAGNINTVGTGSITIAGTGSTLTTQLTGLTNHNVLIGAGTATITNVAPSATSGVALISQGAAADPAFGTVVVAGGGTGATTLTGVLIGNGTSAVTGNAITNHNVLIGGSSNAITSVAPSATSGVPLVSQGAAADPTFGTALVAGGGTGITSATAFAPICGGTTTTGAFQSASTGISTAGFVLTSNGSASLPSFKAISSIALTAPTVQKFTSGSGTYTTPTSPAPLYIRVVLVGPGGGGSAQNTNNGSNGSAATTFGTSLLSGGAGSGGTVANTGGAGGAASLGGATGIAINGASGQPGDDVLFGTGGIGASSYFCGAGAGGYAGLTGGNAQTNSGSGGGGAGGPSVSGTAGQGGGAGGFVDAIITSPAATYSYVVGSGGNGGAAGSVAGGNGAAGIIVVYEYYQ